MNPRIKSINHLWFEGLENSPLRLVADDGHGPLHFSAFFDLVRDAALGFEVSGITPGTLVGVWTTNHFRSAVTELALLALGAVSVRLPRPMAKPAAQDFLENARLRFVVVDQAEQITGPFRDAFRLFELVPTAPSPHLTWDMVLDTGSQERLSRSKAFLERLESTESETIARVIVSSGTAGTPKAVRLSHRAYAAYLGSLRELAPFSSLDRNSRVHVAATALGPLLPLTDYGLLFFESPFRWGDTASGLTITRAGSENTVVDALNALDGYGLTETCGWVQFRGESLPDTSFRLGTHNEIEVRTPQIFSGYAFSDDASGPQIAPGHGPDQFWPTGDQGLWEEAGRVQYRGQLTSRLTLRSGWSLNPEKIENELARHPWIRRVLLVGDGRDRVGAVIEPEIAAIEAFAQTEHLLFSDRKGLLGHPRVLERLRTHIESSNERLPAPEQIVSFVVATDAWLVENGDLTARGSLRRATLAERWTETVFQAPPS